MLTLYICTTNPGKLRDFAVASAETEIRIEPLPGLKGIAPPPEDEPTFAGNAKTKAVYYSRFAPGMMVLADDSGLEVDAIGGAPGVRSARYAADAGFTADGIDGHPVSNIDTLNNLYLLDRLKDVPPGRRQGRYRCVLAAARDGRSLLTADGVVEGKILVAPQGEGGFGYDPLFYLPEMKKSMAEIDLTTKLGLSHRGKALRELLRQMKAAGFR